MVVGSLFTGVGGFDLGFERAGMSIVWQCEADPKCREVLARHWPGVECFDDVRTLCREPAGRSEDARESERSDSGRAGDEAADVSADAWGGDATGSLSGVDVLCGGFP